MNGKRAKRLRKEAVAFVDQLVAVGRLDKVHTAQMRNILYKKMKKKGARRCNSQ